jgi:hypothetical protein
MIFGKKLLNIKCEHGFSLQLSPETLLNLRGIQLNIITNVHGFSSKVSIIFVRF